MGAETKIEWTATRMPDGAVILGATFNPWRGCTKVSEGCKFCYAETMSGRNPSALGVWGPKGTRVVAAESYWRQPLKWNREAEAAGIRRKVFCASLADVFEDDATMPAESRAGVWAARDRLWALIAATPHLDWLLLTKRPENITSMIPVPWRFHDKAPHNVWYGTSVENQAAADERIPHLLKVPARVRFLSCEPLLGPVDLTWLMRHKDERCPRCDSLIGGEAGRCYCGEVHEPLIHWVIAGGESGARARPMHPDWVRSLRDQCTEAGVSFFMKQWGEYSPGIVHAPPDSLRREGDVISWPMQRVGKAAAGRLLDGREWNEVPQ